MFGTIFQIVSVLTSEIAIRTEKIFGYLNSIGKGVVFCATTQN